MEFRNVSRSVLSIIVGWIRQKKSPCTPEDSSYHFRGCNYFSKLKQLTACVVDFKCR